LAALLGIAVLSAMGWGVWLQATTPLKADFRSATQFLAEHLAEGDLLVFQIPHGRYSFDYYLPRNSPRQTRGWEGLSHRVYLPLVGVGGNEGYRWVEGLYTNYGMELAEADLLMSQLVGESQYVWLVATEAQAWDERGLVQAWLEGHGSMTESAQFLGVDVYGYELGETTRRE
jgi:hypothetical protein